MDKQRDNIEAATLVSSHGIEFRARIDTLIRSLFLISGGVLSITIGAFISGKPPAIPKEALNSIVYAWYSLSFSIITALITMFLLIIAQAQTTSKWEEQLVTNSLGKEIIHNPMWLKAVMWIIGIFSFVSCIVGLSCITYGAGQMLIKTP